MKRFRVVAAASLSLAAVCVLVPGSVFAAKGGNGHHAKAAKVVFGTLWSYTAGSSATITTGSGDVAVALNKHTKLVDETAGGTADPAMGDSAAAFVRSHKGSLVAKKLEYSESSSPFAFAKKEFAGRYASSDMTSTPNTLTISNKKGSFTFTTDANTKYYDNHHAVSTPSYQPNERVNVRGRELTDGSWYAAIVSLHHNSKGKGGKH